MQISFIPQQTKKLAKMITASHGEASTWSAQTMRSLGSAARGLNANELDDIPDSSIRDAISEIANTDFSPKQRRVIMKKYRRSRGENGTRVGKISFTRIVFHSLQYIFLVCLNIILGWLLYMSLQFGRLHSNQWECLKWRLRFCLINR